MRIKDKIISDMPRLIWLYKIINPIINKFKNFPVISNIVKKFGFATERSLPEVQDQKALKDIYNNQEISENKVILFGPGFELTFSTDEIV